MLTPMQDTRNFYRKNGYPVVKNVLNKLLVEQGMQDIFTLVAQQLRYLNLPCPSDVNKQTLHVALKTLLDNDVERYKSCLEIAVHLRPYLLPRDVV